MFQPDLVMCSMNDVRVNNWECPILQKVKDSVCPYAVSVFK
jgi:hypothetical protein